MTQRKTGPSAPIAGASDGLLGLAEVKAFRPQLTVLDLMMPVIVGADSDYVADAIMVTLALVCRRAG